MVAFMLVGVAYADEISNDIEAGNPDTTLELLVLSPGGTDRNVGFWVRAINSDGDSGCNIDPGESLTIEVSSSDSSVASVVSPADRRLTFTACAANASDTANIKQATIHPVGQGTATVSVSVVSNNTGAGTFQTATASFTVNVDDPPSVTSTSPANAATDVGTNTSVTVNFSESVGVNASTFALACPAGTPKAFSVSSSPASGYTLTPSAPLPNNTTCTVSVNKNHVSDTDTIDPPAQMVDQYSFSFTTADPAPSDTASPDNASVVISNGATWTNSTSVVLDLAAHDAIGVTRYRLAETQDELESAADVAVSPAQVNFSADNLPYTLSAGDSTAKPVWARFCDAAGNCTDASDTIGLDTVKPVIMGSTGSYVLGTWTNQDVVVSFTCADDAGVANSGIATNTVAGTTLSTSGANQGVTNTGTCTDIAGNVADSVTVSDIDIDKVAPTVSCNAASFILNEPGAQVSAAVTDQAGLSGPLNSTEYGAANTSSVGPKNVSITGYDNAGNSTTVSCAYTVGYNFQGLFAPIDKPNTMNVSKAGQAIPLKWRLTDYFGNPVLSLTSATVTVTGVSCSLGSTTDQVEEVAAGSSGLQNLGDGYYQTNWKSPTSYAGSCKSLNLNLGEGVTRTNLAYISFKK